MTNTIFCACENAYQDQQYGPHRRAWTPVGKASKQQVILKVRCTACGTEHTVAEAKTEKKSVPEVIKKRERKNQ